MITLDRLVPTKPMQRNARAACIDGNDDSKLKGIDFQ